MMNVPVQLTRFMLIAAMTQMVHAQETQVVQAPQVSQGSQVQDDMQVQVRHEGESVLIEVSMAVTASPKQVWQVLTDYDHMASFLPGINSSRAVPQSATRLRVEQTGVVDFGPLHFPFESVRDIELQPYREIRSTAVAGTITSGYAETRLTERGNGTVIHYRSESVPSIQLPFGLGMGTVKARTQEQFARLREEIYRRMEAVEHASGR